MRPNHSYLVTRADMDDQARPRNDLSIRLSEHAGVIGKTGSGKTYFAMKGLLEYLRLRYPKARRYVLDSTDDPDMAKLVHAPLIVEGNQIPSRLWDATYTQVWKPRNSKLPAEYAEWFDRLNDAREPQILVIDEGASITGEAQESLENLLKQMRKHGGTVIILQQGIAGTITDLFRQMTHYFQFRLNREIYDTAMTRAFLDIAREDQRPPRHQYGFFYRRTDGDFPMKEYRDLRDFFGSSIHYH